MTGIVVRGALFGAGIMVAVPLMAGPVAVTNTFTAGTPAKASEVNQNFTDVADAVNDNDGRIASNASAIGRNSDNITSNAAAIGNNSGAIDTMNATVTTLSGSVGVNTAVIGEQTTAIDGHTTAISDNAAAIIENGTTISAHDTAISGISTRVDINRLDLDDHTARIAELEAGGSQANEVWGDLGRLLSGVVTVSQGETVVYGTATYFTMELSVGDAVSINGEVHSVAQINSDVDFVLDAPHGSGAFETAAYTDNDLLLLKSGATEEKFSVGKSGHMIRKIERATGLGPEDDTDNGPIVSRVLMMSKSRPDTALRIGYTDNFRAMNGTSPGCRWELRVDGESCPGGALVYDFYNGAATVATHTSNHVVGYCEGITAGTHEIQVWVGAVGGSPDGDCYTGWSGSRWTIEAEEVY